MRLTVKRGSELSAAELHNLLQLRVEVFVVEQNCAYQELDGLDLLESTFHVCLYRESRLAGYLRILTNGNDNDKPKSVRIGRVVVREPDRRAGIGSELMSYALNVIADVVPQDCTVSLHAQTYVQTFYAGFGFKPIGEPFLEDDIPHIAMAAPLSQLSKPGTHVETATDV